MVMSNQNLLNLTSEINSQSEVGFNLSELSPLYLQDSVGFYGTDPYDAYSSQLYFNENSSYNGYSDLMNGYNPTLMNPNVASPTLAFVPDDNITNVIEQPTSTNACQPEYSENKHYLENELTLPVDSVFEGVLNTSAQQTGLPNFDKNDNAEAQIAEQQEITYKATIDDKKVYPKPACPYIFLVALALKSSQTGALPVKLIYEFISWQFPYYRTAPEGWKRAIRHSLSYNSIFKKLNTTIKRNNLWTIDSTKLDKIDKKILKHSLNIRQAMLHPELLELRESGETKFGGDAKSSQDDFVVDADDAKLKDTSECSEYQLVPVAKRRKTLTGLPQNDYLYEVEKLL